MTGAGTTAVPFTIGTVTDLTRLVTLNGNEPWDVATVGGCSKLVLRCRYSAV